MGEQERITPQDCNSLGRLVAKAVSTALQDPVKRADFEDWYIKRYGHPYVWKTYREVLQL